MMATSPLRFDPLFSVQRHHVPDESGAMRLIFRVLLCFAVVVLFDNEGDGRAIATALSYSSISQIHLARGASDSEPPCGLRLAMMT